MKPIRVILSSLAVLVLAFLAGTRAESGERADPRNTGHLEGIDASGIDWKSKDDAYWKTTLTPLQFEVCREGGTERAFTGEYDGFKKPGVFRCSSCGAPLFSSEAKYESGTGWPSFTKPVENGAVETRKDFSFGMVRTEVVCGRCGAHLGHVFKDGPKPTGERWCMNSVCLWHDPGSVEAAEEVPEKPADGGDAMPGEVSKGAPDAS